MTGKRLGTGFWLAGLLLVLPGPSVAALAERSSPEIFTASYMFQVLGSLLLVFACLFGLVLLLKRMNGIQTTEKMSIQILGSAKVGTREKILLVKAGEQQLLVGVAAGNIRTLHVFESSPDAASKQPGSALVEGRS